MVIFLCLCVRVWGRVCVCARVCSALGMCARVWAVWANRVRVWRIHRRVQRNREDGRLLFPNNRRLRSGSALAETHTHTPTRAHTQTHTHTYTHVRFQKLFGEPRRPSCRAQDYIAQHAFKFRTDNLKFVELSSRRSAGRRSGLLIRRQQIRELYRTAGKAPAEDPNERFGSFLRIYAT